MKPIPEAQRANARHALPRKPTTYHPEYLPKIQGTLALEIVSGIPACGWYAWRGELPTTGSMIDTGEVVATKPGKVLVKFTK